MSQCELTLMMIFRLSWLGVGSSPLDVGIGSLSNMSPNTSMKPYAIRVCCCCEQWFSIDRITGYLPYNTLHYKTTRIITKIKAILQKVELLWHVYPTHLCRHHACTGHSPSQAAYLYVDCTGCHNSAI